ncbi:IS5 family transposase [Kineococcus vitellinus]|uniref:IS5 family transposase n=1 Tax=Kineococcus vitellinus TaxID=2696565 RepID=UPI003B8315A5
MARTEVLTDATWTRIEPLLPSTKPQRGGRWRDHRQVIEAIAWKYRTGSPWRELPAEYGPWQTAYDRFARWAADGTWQRLLEAVQAEADASGKLDWLVAVDSTMVRVHQHGANTSRSTPPGGSDGADEARQNADHAIGRSRGGLTTKTHLAVDGLGRPLAIVLTAGNVNAPPQAGGTPTTVLATVLGEIRIARRGRGRPRTRPQHVVADKGYRSRANRRLLAARGIAATIPERADQLANRRARGSAGGRPYRFEARTYRQRNVVERAFNRLKQWRGLATRYDKHAHHYRAGLLLASLLLWLK